MAAEIAPIPRGEHGAPVFREPWEAQAFAMTLALHERGVFTWPEWAQALAGEISRAQASGDRDDGSTYYRHWLAAIERLVSDKGIASPETLVARKDALGPGRPCDAARGSDPSRERPASSSLSLGHAAFSAGPVVRAWARSRASSAHFLRCASRLITCRLGSPQ